MLDFKTTGSDDIFQIHCLQEISYVLNAIFILRGLFRHPILKFKIFPVRKYIRLLRGGASDLRGGGLAVTQKIVQGKIVRKKNHAKV